MYGYNVIFVDDMSELKDQRHTNLGEYEKNEVNMKMCHIAFRLKNTRV